jgi:hypothetical protein
MIGYFRDIADLKRIGRGMRCFLRVFCSHAARGSRLVARRSRRLVAWIGAGRGRARARGSRAAHSLSGYFHLLPYVST